MKTLIVRFNFEGEMPTELKKFCKLEKSESYEVTALAVTDEFAKMEKIEGVIDGYHDAHEKITRIEEILSSL